MLPIVETMNRKLTNAVPAINQCEYEMKAPLNSIMRTIAANIVPPRNAVTCNEFSWNGLLVALLSFSGISIIEDLIPQYFYFQHCPINHLYGSIRTTFVLVIFTYFEFIVLVGKAIEKCAYCNSQKIIYQSKGMLRKYLRYITVGWLTPDSDTDKVERTKQIRCKECCKRYQRLNVKKSELVQIRKSLLVLKSTMLEFRAIFGNTDFAMLFEHILYIVQPENGAMHIIFRVCKIKAFLDCRIIQGGITVISVERIF